MFFESQYILQTEKSKLGTAATTIKQKIFE